MIYKKIIMSLLLMLMFASASSQDVSSYVAASQSFLEKVKQLEQKKVMPRLTDSDVAPLISILADSGRFLDGFHFEKKDLTALMGVCSAAGQVAGTYAMFDVKGQLDVKAPPAVVSAKLLELIQRNIYLFQAELSVLQPFQIKCMAKVVLPLIEFMKGLRPDELTEVRIAGLGQARGGIANVYVGLLQTASDPMVGNAYKSALFEALSETSQTYQSIMQLPARKQIIDLVMSIPPASAEPFRRQLDKINAAMSNTACIDICAIN